MAYLFELAISAEFWFSMIRLTTPLLLVTLAAVVAGKAGSINIALEGTMLVAAFAGVIVSHYTASLLLGVSAALLAGMALSNALAYFALLLKANIVLTGIALNIFGSGATIFFLYQLTGDRSISSSLNSLMVPTLAIALIEDIPFVGAVLSGHSIITYLAIAAVAAVHILFNYTAMGLKIRAVGENPKAAESVGISVVKVKFIALNISGFLGGMAGVYLSMSYLSWFSAGMSAGRGYIALAARVIAGDSAIGSLFAASVFGFAENLANYLQLYNIPEEFIQMLPYVITIIGFVLINAQNRTRKKKFKRTMPWKQRS